MKKYTHTPSERFLLTVDTFTDKHLTYRFNDIDDAHRFFLDYIHKVTSNKVVLQRLNFYGRVIGRIAEYSAPFYKYVLFVLTPYPHAGEKRA